MVCPMDNPDEDFERVKAFDTQALVVMKAPAEHLIRRPEWLRLVFVRISIRQRLPTEEPHAWW